MDRRSIEGVLMGTAVGDSLGLPAEGLTPAQIKRRGWRGDWRHRFVFGRGMWSDDTEHSVMLAQALGCCGGEEVRFGRDFARQLRWWLVGLPAGVGLATARSILRLWCGFPMSKSGVFSAGNGPCMRAAIIGVVFADDAEQRTRFNELQTKITHRDPRALTASRAVVELAAHFSISQRTTVGETLELIRDPNGTEDWDEILEQLRTAHQRRLSVGDLLNSIGGSCARGISGFAFQTVPAVIHAGNLHHWDYEQTVGCVLDAGGDADTAGAIAGALCGAMHGPESIPEEWIQGVCEWPTSMDDLSRLAEALTTERKLRVRAAWSPTLLLRNLWFFIIVLAHGVARPFIGIFPAGPATKPSTDSFP